MIGSLHASASPKSGENPPSPPVPPPDLDPIAPCAPSAPLSLSVEEKTIGPLAFRDISARPEELKASSSISQERMAEIAAKLAEAEEE